MPIPTPRFVILLSALVASLAVAEVGLRAAGRSPWKPGKAYLRVEPAGAFYERHPTLGYRHRAGRFKLTLPNGCSFTVTHGSDTLRITHPQDADRGAPDRKGIWIFGCSFTHGWSLNDPETYPWKLQARLPSREVVNFGVGGYGTVHAVIQLREALRSRPPPVVAVLAYASFHDERSAFLRRWRKLMTRWNHLGTVSELYARFAGNGGLAYFVEGSEYPAIPGIRKSALLNSLDDLYDRIEDRFVRSDQVSLELIREFRRECERHGIVPVVAGIWPDDPTRERLETLAAEGIRTVDIAVSNLDPSLQNLPCDSHPNAWANEHYAASLESFLAGVIGEATSHDVALPPLPRQPARVRRIPSSSGISGIQPVAATRRALLPTT